MQHDPIVIVSIARTPIACLLGQLKDASAVQLGATAIKAAVERAHLKFDTIDEVIMGCVLSAGQGQAPARQAAIHAGLANSTVCTTVNKMCGSGMKAVMSAHDALMAGSHNIIVAGGMESMTNAPYLLPKARQGYRMGHAQMLDHMFYDGLEDAYDKGQLMGVFAEACAKQFNFSRQRQDDFAITSLKRAQQAIANGYFNNEITPVTIATRQGAVTVATDEQPGLAKFEKIPQLKPAFDKDGTVTAANSSSISDGAAAVVLMRLSTAKQLNLPPLAKIIGHSTYAQEPKWFTTAPIYAIKKLLSKINWQINEVDLFEINEAFAVVALAAMQELAIPHDKLNVNGGACALGHPIGASGARILVTLIAELKRRHLTRGVASLCIGGGEATAMAVELIH
jgi:acetyl-CoA C-acetyltransferase